MPTPENIETLTRVLDPANIRSRGYFHATPREAAAALLDAIRTNPAVQDAVLAALVEAGRLVEVGGPLVCGWCGHLWTDHGDVWSWECRRADCLCPEFSSHRECRFIEPGWREAP